MKKNIFKLALCALVAVPAFTSCEMDQIPESNTVPEKTWNNLTDAESYRVGMYSSLRGVSGGIYTLLSDLQTDLFVATENYGNYYGMTWKWQFQNSEVDDQTSIWAANYSFIATVNNVLGNIDKVEVADESEQVELDQIKGEAYMFRAMAYHTLATYFCKDYEPATAASDLGLPIVTVVDVDALPRRASLEDTYKFILDDLHKADSLMTDNNPRPYLTDASVADYMVNRDSRDLFEARVRLFAHDYAKAITLAQGVMGNYPLITTAEGLEDMYTNDKGSEIMFQIFQSKDERGPSWDLFLGYQASYTAAWAGYGAGNVYAPSWYPSMDAMSLFGGRDIRTKVYFLMEGTVIAGNNIIAPWYTGEQCILFKKFPGNPALAKTTSDYYNMHDVFRVPEAYLIAAEASYLNGDETSAVTYLNQLHNEARKGSKVTATGENLFAAIKNEWVLEYMGEGLRFGCLKRWHDGFKRSDRDKQQTGTASGAGIEILPDNQRWVWEIPQQDLNANPDNLERNWN